jgi:hypothetical protein
MGFTYAANDYIRTLLAFGLCIAFLIVHTLMHMRRRRLSRVDERIDAIDDHMSTAESQHRGLAALTFRQPLSIRRRQRFGERRKEESRQDHHSCRDDSIGRFRSATQRRSQWYETSVLLSYKRHRSTVIESLLGIMRLPLSVAK